MMSLAFSLTITATSFADTPPNDFLNAGIYSISNEKTAEGGEASVGEFVTKGFKTPGTWSKGDANQWLYRTASGNPATNEKNDITLTFENTTLPEHKDKSVVILKRVVVNGNDFNPATLFKIIYVQLPSVKESLTQGEDINLKPFSGAKMINEIKPENVKEYDPKTDHTVRSAKIVDGKIARDYLDRTIQRLLYQEKFAELEKIANDYRKTKAKLPEGVWKLEIYYYAFEEPKEKSPEGWQVLLAKLDKWQKLYPQSITARVAAANAWMYYGWAARGKGFAITITDEGSRLLHDRMQHAIELLRVKPGRATDDCPERFNLLLTFARTQGANREEFEALFDQAIKFEPAYPQFYIQKAEYLLPKWHGEAGESQAFAKTAVTLWPDRAAGNTIYARITASLHSDEGYTAFNESEISWPMMKQGYRDIERNYPGSKWNLNNFGKFACLAGDKETARDLLVRIGERPYIAAWQGRGEFEKCREWAGVVEKRDPKQLENIINDQTNTEDFLQMMKLAQEGDAQSQYDMAQAYITGKNSSDNYPTFAKAAYWLKKAAEQGHPMAQGKLGSYYLNGFGVPKDRSKALEWFRLGSENGDWQSLRGMGEMYLTGSKTLPKDLIKSYAFLMQATYPTDETLKKVEALLTPEQLADARKAADNLKKNLATKRIE